MVDKISKAAKIEAGNLMEEAKDVFDGCVSCGMREKRSFSRWQVASLAGGRSLRLQGLGQQIGVFGSVNYGC